MTPSLIPPYYTPPPTVPPAHHPRHLFEIKIGAEYINDLKKRLQQAEVSHGALAREMGWSASQLSRSFNKPIMPSMKTVERMETAFRAIILRREKDARKQQAGRNVPKRAD